MAYCSNCGKELTENAEYCIHCGTRVGGSTPYRWQERWDRSRDRWEHRRQNWEHKQERGDGNGWWGVVSGFGFLIVIALTISTYPDVFVQVGNYFARWGTLGHPVLPGRALGQVVIFFFTAGGIWGLVSASLRFAFTSRFSRPMRDVVGALFSLYIAGAFSQFYAGTINGSGLLFAFFVGLGVVIIANAAIAIFLPHRLVHVTKPL